MSTLSDTCDAMRRRHRPPTAHPVRPVTRDGADRTVMRMIVDFCEIWEGCRGACRRRNGCASSTVGCFDCNIERVRTYTRRLADWPRIDGPRELDELVEPVDDLLD